MTQEFAMYYIAMFALSYAMLSDFPSKQPQWANMVGTAIAAMFGFALWPVYLWAWVRFQLRGDK